MTTAVDAPPIETAPAAPPTLADPTPLAFAAVGLPFGIVCLGLTGKVTKDLSTVTLPLVLIYGTFGLLIAGVIAFRTGDHFAAFTYTSFSAFFGSFAAIQVLLALKVTSIQANDFGVAAAYFLGSWTIIITYLLVLVMKYPPLFRVIFSLVWVTLVLLTIGFAGSSHILTAAAWLGVLVALLCLYASAAVLINTVRGKTSLPI